MASARAGRNGTPAGTAARQKTAAPPSHLGGVGDLAAWIGLAPRQHSTIGALQAARAPFPFPLRGVDFDNDSLFMNEAVVG